MTRKYYLSLFIFIIIGYANAQSNLLNSKSVEEIDVKSEEELAIDIDKPLPYGYISDRDILWSKIVWEFIDLNQKINFTYYFPIDTTSIVKSRRSLFHTLLAGIRNGKIKEVYEDSFFNSKITREELESKLINVRDDGGYVDTFQVKAELVTGYMIKGMWYFDKRQGELKYRLIALAPMGPDVKTLGLDDIEDDELYELFWVFLPSARDVLHERKVFNPKSGSDPISFDHLLNSRRFNAVILREQNVYENRAIKDYIRENSLFQLLEADRIKEGIRDKEMDMWNY